jgi:hypothetical protein
LNNLSTSKEDTIIEERIRQCGITMLRIDDNTLEEIQQKARVLSLLLLHYKIDPIIVWVIKEKQNLASYMAVPLL